MAEILNFRNKLTIIELNAAVTNLNERPGNFNVPSVGETRTWNIYHLTG
jgi:hypothetical protein